MSANLPPDYFAAESALRAASTPQAKLEALEIDDQLPLMLTSAASGVGLDALRARVIELHT